MRLGKGCEGKVSLNIGHEHLCQQMPLASLTAGPVATSLVPASFPGWHQPCSMWQGWDLMYPDPHRCCTSSIQHCDQHHAKTNSALRSVQAQPYRDSDRAGNAQKYEIKKSWWSNVREFLSKLCSTPTIFQLLGKSQPKSILRSGKSEEHCVQLTKLFSFLSYSCHIFFFLRRGSRHWCPSALLLISFCLPLSSRRGTSQLRDAARECWR